MFYQNHACKEVLTLLQPDTKGQPDLHHIALMYDHIFYFIGSDSYTMHLKDYLSQPDRAEFIKAKKKELQENINWGHWKLIPTKHVPKDKIPLPMVWSIKRKRYPMREIKKRKAHFWVGTHKSIEYIDFWNTYPPLVSWNTVRLMLDDVLPKMPPTISFSGIYRKSLIYRRNRTNSQ